MKLGSLFSGGGLGDFGFLAAGFDIRWQVEIDDYCQKILEVRYPESKKYRDIKTIKGADLEKVDIITGGFPCQPFSNAGQRMGDQDDRHLWPQMLRIIQEAMPTWVVGENVLGIINLGIDAVLADLEASGYSAIPIVFPAHALGAWHRRERVWIIAHRLQRQTVDEKQTTGIEQSGEISNDVADTELCRRIHGQAQEQSTEGRIDAQREPKPIGEDVPHAIINGRRRGGAGCSEKARWWSHAEAKGYSAWRKYWQSEPAVGRVAHGIADRVERLKMLGNGQVPVCTYAIGMFIQEVERQMNENLGKVPAELLAAKKKG